MKQICSYYKKSKHKKMIIFVIISFLLLCFINPPTQKYLYEQREQGDKQAYAQEFDSVISPVPSGFKLIDEKFYYVDGLNRIEAMSSFTRTYRVNSTREKVSQALKPLFQKHNIKLDELDEPDEYARNPNTSSTWFASDSTDDFTIFLYPDDESFPSVYFFPGSTPVNQVTIELR